MGNPCAQWVLGKIYEEGIDTSVDYHEAAHWYRSAARQSYARAQLALGRLYEIGKGVPGSSYPAAAHYYRLAAEQGADEAQYRLGSLLYRGAGLPEDLAQAQNWFALAAKQGHKEAQIMLRRVGRG